MRTRHVFDLSVADHAWAKAMRRITVEPDGCWRWAGGHTHDGYARVQAKVLGKGWVGARLHRLLYVITHAGDDPVSLHHQCHHRWCVNPDHLVPTTPQAHRAEHHRQEECANGHSLEGDNLLQSGDGRRRCRVCANARIRQWNRDRAPFHRGPWKTECKWGHPWVPENIYTRANGSHECRTCIKARTARLKAERQTG